MSDPEIRIIVVDEHKLGRIGWKTVLETTKGTRVIGEAADGIHALSLIEELQPDIVLMSLNISGINCLEAAERINALNRNAPRIKLVIMAPDENEYHFFAALSVQPRGYCTKYLDSRLLPRLISTVHQGGAWFDPYMAAAIYERFIHRPPGSMPVPSKQVQLSQAETTLLRRISSHLDFSTICRNLYDTPQAAQADIRALLLKLSKDPRVQRAAARIRTLSGPSHRKARAASTQEMALHLQSI